MTIKRRYRFNVQIRTSLPFTQEELQEGLLHEIEKINKTWHLDDLYVGGKSINAHVSIVVMFGANNLSDVMVMETEAAVTLIELTRRLNNVQFYDNGSTRDGIPIWGNEKKH